MSIFSDIRKTFHDHRLDRAAKKLIEVSRHALKTNQATDIAFSWSKSKSSLSDKTRISAGAPAQTDITENLVINSALTEGFYNNEYPGLKLAGAFAKTPIDKPVQFMGIPTPIIDNEKQQQILTDWIADNLQIVKDTHRFSMINGTRYVWPWFDSKSGKIKIDFIQDSAVSLIKKDITTGEMIELRTDEQITVAYDDNLTTTIRRKRYYTKQSVKIIYTQKGAIADQLEDIEYRNVLGILPIVFANDRKEGEIKGKTAYAQILPDCKIYHDIHLQYSRMLSKFNVKMVQSSADIDSWKTNNNVTSLAYVDIYDRDLILNQGEDEKTEYIFPDGAFDSYEKALSLVFWKIIQGSQIPEIFWGLNAQGNHASVEDSRAELIKYVQAKREQFTNSWFLFFSAILALNNIVNMQTAKNTLTVKWNSLDAVDEKTRAEIFKNFAEGVSKLVNSAGCTKQQLYELWLELYPAATEDTYEDFEKNLVLMARHKAFSSTPFEIMGDVTGEIQG